MIKPNVVKLLISSASVAALSGCSLASMPSGYSSIEKQTVQELSSSNYTPRSENERAAILTQDLFAQATFWSREYDLNPADLEAAINLANTLRRLGNPGKSIEVAQTTRALYPRDVDLMAELSAALIANNNPKDALPIIDAALGQRPNMARLWSLKGAALDQFEQFPEARQSYSKGLSFAPNDPGIISNVGLSYALEGDPETAEIWLRRAANMPGASASTRQNLSLVLGLQNKFDEAEKWARRDLDQQTVANNMSYIRTLRGPSVPVTNIQKPARPQTYRDVQPLPKAGLKAGLKAGASATYGQTVAANYQRPKPVLRPQTQQVQAQRTQQPYGSPYQQTSKLTSPKTRLTNYGQAGSAEVNGASVTSARDAALAAAKNAAANPYANVKNRLQQTSQISQKVTTQNLLSKISQNNTPKAKIAQLQQQQLAARTQMRQQIQQPAQQQIQPHPYSQSVQPSAPYGALSGVPNIAYPQPPQEQPVNQPARQKRR